MLTDPIATADLVQREVRTGQRDGEATRIVVARRTYATEQADLWDAVTNPERLPRWFLPVTGELRVGGRYQLEGNAGGTVQRCDEPERFAVTWGYAEQVSCATGVGWELGLVGLGLYLASGAPVDPEAALSWPTTPDGVAFVRHVAAGWARAAVSDGDDAAAANDAAENTVVFYTVEPET
jgi:uncharacterized protein YndB with AHSA1/START domain